MVREELPAWCAERGFDTGRIAAWGWSMGGYGALLLAQTFPGLRAVGGRVLPGGHAGRRGVRRRPAADRGLPVGLWCGRDDGLYDDVAALHRALPAAPVAGGYTAGRHNFGYWSRVVPSAFAFVASTLR